MNNVIKISELEKQGYKGPDVSLVISLLKYGFCYLENDTNNNNDLKIYYSVGDKKFSWAWFKSDLDVKKEFNWIDDWVPFIDYMGFVSGNTKKHFEEGFTNWNKQELWLKIYDLINYYGHENICGSRFTNNSEFAVSIIDNINEDLYENDRIHGKDVNK